MAAGHWYYGRPGASPVLAALYAAGVIKNSHRVLDVGTMDGTDAIALCKWGVRDVHAIDIRAGSGRLGRAPRRLSPQADSSDQRFDLPSGARSQSSMIARNGSDSTLSSIAFAGTT